MDRKSPEEIAQRARAAMYPGSVDHLAPDTAADFHAYDQDGRISNGPVLLIDRFPFPDGVMRQCVVEFPFARPPFHVGADHTRIESEDGASLLDVKSGSVLANLHITPNPPEGFRVMCVEARYGWIGEKLRAFLGVQPCVLPRKPSGLATVSRGVIAWSVGALIALAVVLWR